MYVYVGKTEWILNTRGDAERLVYQGQELKRVELFKYLSVHVDTRASVLRMTEQRLSAAIGAKHKINRRLVSKGWKCKRVRLVVYHVYTQSSLLFGSSLWGCRHLSRARGVGTNHTGV